MCESSSLERLEEVKKIIRSLLISAANREVTLNYFKRMYKEVTDENVPFNDFQFTSLRDFLSSMPEVVRLYCKNNEIYIAHIDTEKSRHITNLVKKAKGNSRSFKKRSINLIDPILLHKTLQTLMDSATVRQNCKSISKIDVLSQINSEVGEHTSYTIEDLSTQLHEFTHLLNHDDDYIYFKNTKVFNLDDSESCDMDQSIARDSVGDLIRDSTKNRLRELIEKYPEGIWCSELPSKYQQAYRVELEYTDLGFNSIVQFVAALSDIFRIVTPPDTKRQMVVDARKPLQRFKTFQPSNTQVHPVTEYSGSNSEAVPTSLSYKVAQALAPKNVMTFYDTVDIIKVESLCSNEDKYIDVTVTEVQHPSFFWVILRKNKNLLNKLMGELQDFYCQQELDNHNIPQVLLQPGLHVACQLADIWHRAILKRVKLDEIEALFYDYGSTAKVKKESLYFLNKKFMYLPAQAIPCGIHNVKPKDKNKWLTQVCKKFLNRVLDKDFVANIISTHPQGNSMMVNLIDVSRDDCEVSIDQWLIHQKLAQKGETICKKLNPTHEHYQLCAFKNDCAYERSFNGSATGRVTTSFDDTANSTASSSDKPVILNYMSTAEKLEALKKYNHRYSRNSDDCQNEETVSTKRFKSADS